MVGFHRRTIDCPNAKGIVPNTKKDRRNDAKNLPEGLTQEDLPKYITYNVNTYGKHHEFSREFFRIESHPLLSTIWSSTTKKSVSLRDKLQQAKDALDYLNTYKELPPKVERELPPYVTYYVEREHHLLAWQKHEGEQRLSKKITLQNDYYDLEKEEQEKELLRLNREVIKKYENKYSIFTVDETTLHEIEMEKAEELPSYVRTQEFYDGLYLVFNKSKGEQRITLTAKLPPNYNINKELYKFNTKIVEKHGTEHAISLDKFPYDIVSEETVEIPAGMYVLLKCKKPYIFMKRGDDTFTHKLPERYDLKEQISLAQLNQTKDQEQTMDDYKQLFAEGTKPDNISICLKDGRYFQLQYKMKTKQHRHDKAMTLPKSATFNINIELIKMNKSKPEPCTLNPFSSLTLTNPSPWIL